MFKKGDIVKVNVTVPTGPIIAMRMNDDGVVSYLVQWTENGTSFTRWFEQDELSAG